MFSAEFVSGAIELVKRLWLPLLLVALLVVQTVRIEGFKLWPLSFDGFKAEAQEAKDALAADRARAKAAADQQKQTTARNIIVYRDRIVEGGKVAERIENAPAEPGCKTPSAIMGADL